MNSLTRQHEWDKGYVARQKSGDLKLGWRDHTNDLIAAKIEGMGLAGKSVLEIGAGDSQWLPYFAKKYPDSRFVGLDYSEAGCERLAMRASAIREEATIEIYQQDMFAMESVLHRKFDVVLSFGVVEHFSNLPHALLVKGKYLKEGGVMFSLIPNMTGSIGYLTRLFNRRIYEMHNPHDWKSFVEGHNAAGLTVVSSGYLGSSNFGVLSSCFEEPQGFNWHTYVFLTRVSKAAWLLESKLCELPRTRMFSPYIFAVGRASH